MDWVLLKLRQQLLALLKQYDLLVGSRAEADPEIIKTVRRYFEEHDYKRDLVAVVKRKKPNEE